MYIDGMREEGILKDRGDDDIVQSQQTQFGKPQQLGPRKITPDELSSRTVNIPKVNWEPPT